MDSSYLKITHKQRRSCFSSIPFCTTHYFNTDNNKVSLSHSDVNMSSSPCPNNFESLLKRKNSSISHFYLQQSSSTGNTSNTSSGDDGTQTTNSGSMRTSVPHPSHIVTRHAPYQMPYHHRGNRSHRGAGHPRGEPLPKKTTGIPRDRLIPVPKHMSGVMRDQSGTLVVPRQVA
jgi:hypothetical protein